MAIPPTPTGLRRLLQQTSTYDILIASFASIIAFSAAMNYSAQGRTGLAILHGLGAAAVWIFTIIKRNWLAGSVFSG